MFTWLNKQGVQSDRGFALQFTGRFSAEYREGSEKVTLEIESGTFEGGSCIIIDPRAFSRWDDGRDIPKIKQEIIFRNIAEALEFQDLIMVIEAGRRG